LHASIQSQGGAARQLVFKQLADNPMTELVASRISVLQQSKAETRSADQTAS
jgi:hypothetical protein